ncbi:MAG TPA: Npt1/Npt2 family nucleotide transporter [Pseudomonadales bacterium]|jgi:AAA family ATP:ADP antiporter|nr:Npt1/Npt2 family nucleotide transporter [Pseudomonadales bacterium]MDP6315444.1 Npt1/Npt2 family nucleotide transporter [Pseudomonadales bacterium]MDP7315099.1 Npt1/Npt2 family nucleotide transporter [Pseudomonadales bacterium]HJP49843.1 Npt1/Npt2 family nucleotide transporter [Pseudomonadales bacterium]|tara:strand:- start:626 stop:1837 length:1212 start_codon:yes stop_codon:yes gene_type:complete
MNKQYQVAVLMALAALFTLAGYEFIRSASTVLFKSAYGAENLPLVMAAMPVVVFLGVALYGRILSALGPRRTLLVTSLGSGLLIFTCYLLVVSGSKVVTPFLYLIKELYIVLLIEQYWSYINSSLAPDTAKKLNGPITGIAGFGGALGGTLVGMTAGEWGTEAMLLFASVSVIPAALVSNLTYRLHGEPEVPTLVESSAGHMGWHWFKGNPTLTYLLVIVLISQLVAAVLDLKFQGLLSIQFAGNPDEETAFQGWFFGTLNTSVLLLQFIIAPVLMSLVALRWVHILMPLIHVTAIGLAIVEPTVFSVGLAFFLFKAFDYSVFRAAKEVLYVPLGFDERYRAKQIIDVFGYRTGKGASSVVIVLLQRAGVLMSNYYLAAGFIATVVWLVLIFPLTRHAKATQD